MKITGTTAVYFTVGQPVAQVRAPEVLNYVLNGAAKGAVVVPAAVAPPHIEAFVSASMASPTVKGFFVAIPHEAPLLEAAARATQAALVAGATNALGRGPDGAIVADLFDGAEFLRALGHFGIQVEGRSIQIVGAGGAACAIGTALAAAGAGAISFWDVAPGKARVAAERIDRHCSVRAIAMERPKLSGQHLVVNASPMGLKASDPLPLDAERLDAGTALVDIIMTPRPTPLIQRARQRGLRAFPGYEMFVQQVPLYLRFFGYGSRADQLERDLSAVRRYLVPGDAAP